MASRRILIQRSTISRNPITAAPDGKMSSPVSCRIWLQQRRDRQMALGTYGGIPAHRPRFRCLVGFSWRFPILFSQSAGKKGAEPVEDCIQLYGGNAGKLSDGTISHANVSASYGNRRKRGSHSSSMLRSTPPMPPWKRCRRIWNASSISSPRTAGPIAPWCMLLTGPWGVF